MSRIIIGSHGLQNKPPRIILEKWWKKAIKEGLWEIDHPRIFINFTINYWAHFLYPKPLDFTETDPEHPLYVKHPYVPAKDYDMETPSRIGKEIFDNIVSRVDRIIFNKTKYFNLNALGYYFFIKRRFKDLHSYYNKMSIDKNWLEKPVKAIVRSELARMLRKHKNKDILLIGHSMGSIIAHDVLTLVAPEVKIHTMITFGSPLGSQLLQKEILDEQKERGIAEPRLATPENIEHNWFNFADVEDRVAVNRDFKHDFQPNSKGVQVIDTIVNNDYVYKGIPGQHQSFGYLRTREVAAIIHNFLSGGEETGWDNLRTWSIKKFAKKDRPEKEEPTL